MMPNSDRNGSEEQHPYRIIREAGSHRFIVETDDIEFAREIARVEDPDD